jgi:hypothetical protein
MGSFPQTMHSHETKRTVICCIARIHRHQRTQRGILCVLQYYKWHVIALHLAHNTAYTLVKFGWHFISQRTNPASPTYLLNVAPIRIYDNFIGSLLRYLSPIHTTYRIGTSVKGPTGPSSSDNYWKFCWKRKNARFGSCSWDNRSNAAAATWKIHNH